MYTAPTTTSSFPSSIARRCWQMTSRSLSRRLQRKSLSATTLSLKRLVATTIISTYSVPFLPNTAVRTWSEHSKASPHANCSSDFLCSKKSSEAVSSGATASTLPPSASGGTGRWLSFTLPRRERRWENRSSSDYSHRVMPPAIPHGLPWGG